MRHRHVARGARTGGSAVPGAIALGAALEKNSTLIELHLRDNQIGDAGVTALAGACASGSLASLRMLGLDENKIGDEGGFGHLDAQVF